MSRFANLKKIIDAPQETQPTPALPEPPVNPVEEPVVPEVSPSPTAAVKKRGRPEGKRSDPNYTSTTFYIEKNVLQATQVKLIQEGKTRDVSELVNQLLKRWAAGELPL